MLADNKIAEQAGWDREMLAIELEELIDLLPAQEMDISLTGFDTAEIDLLLADMRAPQAAPEDSLPNVPNKPHAQRRSLAPRAS